MMLGVLGMIGGLVGLAGIAPAGVAAIVLTAALGALPGYPLLSIRLGRLPVPELPQQPLDMLKQTRTVPRSEIFEAVARADEVLTGLLLGVSVASLPCVLVLLADGQRSGWALVLDGALALLLRGRLFPTARQRIPLMVAGLAAVVVPLLAVAAASDDETRAVLVAVVLVVAACVLVSTLIFSRRAPSPFLGRAADIIDVIAIVALIPTTAIVAGLFGYVQDIFSSAV
jgi:type VII secretion integral membrane protein EccD